MSAIMSAEKARTCNDLDVLGELAETVDSRLARLIRAFCLANRFVSTDDLQRFMVLRSQWSDVNELAEQLELAVWHVQDVERDLAEMLASRGAGPIHAASGSVQIAADA